VVILFSLCAGVLIALTTLDPIVVTEYSIVLSAAALPLTYLPILLVANDPAYMKDRTNSRLLNAVASIFLVLLIVVSIGTIPLMIWTKAGA
jgi:manganese transport protein